MFPPVGRSSLRTSRRKLDFPEPDGPMTVAFQPSGDGRLAGVYFVRNPDKLGHIG